MKEVIDRTGVGALFTDILHVFVMVTLAVSPLYETLSRYPEFFIAHYSGVADMAALAAISLIVPISAVAALEAALYFVSARARAVFHLSIMAALAALALLPVAKWVFIGVGDALVLSAAALASVIFAWAYARTRLHALVSLASPAAALVPLIFLFNSPIYRVGLPAQAGTGQTAAAVSRTPVIIAVFDELPASTLMDANRRIDPALFPNFSALAEDSLWFRNASTVHAETIYSIPAILTGRYPDGRTHLPKLSDHPENLFTLLGPSGYELKAMECCTRLCPEELNRIAKPPFSGRVPGLLSDAWYVYLNLIAPPRLSASLPAVNLWWQGFAAARGKGFENPQFQRGKTFRRFIASIEGPGSPALYFIHLNLPHSPWVYYPSGRRYPNAHASTHIPGLTNDGWTQDEGPVIQAFQRHILQTQYTDRLLGELIAKLKETGLYERSVIVVTADHGVSFRPGDHSRSITATNYADILSVPLLIKTPGLKGGVVSDRNARTIDMLPTLADALRITVPWRVDGVSLLDEKAPEPQEKVIYNGPMVRGELNRRYVFGPRLEGIYETLERKLSIFGADPFRVGPYREMVGQAVSQFLKRETTAVRIAYNIAAREESSPGDMIARGHLSGVARNLGHEPVHLAVSVNGVIRALTRSERPAGGEGSFSVILPDTAFAQGRNSIETFLVTGPGSLVRLSDTPYHLEKEGSGEVIVLRDQDGGELKRIPVSHASMLGVIEYAETPDDKLSFLERFEDDSIMFYGWAGDPKLSACADLILVYVDGRFYAEIVPRKNYVLRPEIGKSRGLPADCGFHFGIPLEAAAGPTGRDAEIRVFALTPRGYATELNYHYGYKWGPGSESGKSALSRIRAPVAEIPPIVSGVVEGWLDLAEEYEVSGKDKNFVKRMVYFSGWAVDLRNEEVPERIMIFADSRLILSGRTTHFRSDIVEGSGKRGFEKSGFELSVPATAIPDGAAVRLFAVTKNNLAGELKYYKGYRWDLATVAQKGPRHNEVLR